MNAELLQLNNSVHKLKNGQVAGPFELTVTKDEAWAFIGGNGSGKTILCEVLANNTKLVDGEATFPPKCEYVSFERVDEIIEEERYNDDTDLTNEIDHGRTIRQFLELEDDSPSILTEFGISHLLERNIKYLSTGEMRKALICKALLADADLLVLDEPFEGLDIESNANLAVSIAKLIEAGHNIILMVNRLKEIPECFTNIGYIRDSHLAICGKKDELLNSEAFLKLNRSSYEMPEKLPGHHRIAEQERYDGEDMFVLNDVNISYSDKKILNKATWCVKAGENWRIAGPNGCGKSTLLSIITGDHPQSYANDVHLFGIKRGSGESIWDIKKRIGIVTPLLQRDYRVSTTLLNVIISGFYDSIGVYARATVKQKEEAMEWLRIIHLADKANQNFRNLSFGEQRMVLIARAMVKHPQVLILDEPCLGLDAPNREMVLKLVDYVGTNSESQLLYVSHHPEEKLSCVSHNLTFVPVEDGGYTVETVKY